MLVEKKDGRKEVMLSFKGRLPQAGSILCPASLSLPVVRRNEKEEKNMTILWLVPILLQGGREELGGTLCCLLGLALTVGVIGGGSWLIISGTVQGRNEKKDFSAATTLAPEKALERISLRMASLGYVKTHSSETSVVLNREVSANLPMAIFWLIMGLIPGILYLMYGKYTASVTVEAAPRGEGSEVFLASKGRVAVRDTATIAGELPQA